MFFGPFKQKKKTEVVEGSVLDLAMKADKLDQNIPTTVGEFWNKYKGYVWCIVWCAVGLLGGNVDRVNEVFDVPEGSVPAITKSDVGDFLENVEALKQATEDLRQDWEEFKKLNLDEEVQPTPADPELEPVPDPISMVESEPESIIIRYNGESVRVDKKE